MKKISFALLVLLTFMVSDANATRITWTGGGVTDDWNDPLNWDLFRAPLATDSVFTSYGDDLTIAPGYIARCIYFKLIGSLDIESGGELVIDNGQFEALGDVINNGTIRINASPAEGLIFSTQAGDVSFQNQGEIFIDDAAMEGLVIRNDQVFTNTSGSIIEITNSTFESFVVEGIINNSGILRIGASTDGVAININRLGAEVNNLPCGRMVVLDQFVINEGTFNNSGFFKQNYDGDNDFQSTGATVNNHAIVEDIHGSFNQFDFDIQSIWLRKIFGVQIRTGEATEPFVNMLPANTNFSDIYTDKLLTQNAGIYDPANNNWIPNENANGLTTFFLEIGQFSGICKDTVRFDLELPVAETVYWKGGSGSWQIGFNWSTGNVPNLTDEVAIYNQLDQVSIPFDYTANAKNIFLGGELIIQALATLNIEGNGEFQGIDIEGGSLTNRGNLNISGFDYGIDILNGSLINHHDILCSNTSYCIDIDQSGSLSAELHNTGTIENDAGYLILGDDSEIINLGSFLGNSPEFVGIKSQNLTNEGLIHVAGNNIGTGIDGVIFNKNTGTLSVEKLNVGVEIEGENSGLITSSSCNTGVEIADDFQNQSGGEILVFDSDIGIEIHGGDLSNQTNARIKLKRNGQYGLYIPKSFISAAYLLNDGYIHIDTTAGIGIFCNNDIVNQGLGSIEIRNSAAEGLYLYTESALLTNKDQAIVSVKKSSGNGISVEGGEIRNENEAWLYIDSTLNSAIFLGDYFNGFIFYYGILNNSANIDIGPTSSTSGISLEIGTTLTNEECTGKIINASTLDLQGSLVNDGRYRHLSTLPSSTPSPILNNGILEDSNKGLFSFNLSNNGIYIGQKPGTYTEKETINNILELSPVISTGFTIENTWYLNKELTIIGGVYAPNQNKLLVSSAAVDSSVFYFRTQNSNCSPNLLDTFYLKMVNPIDKICHQIEWVGGKGEWNNSSMWLEGRLPGTCDSVLVAGVLDSILLNYAEPIEIGHLKNYGLLGISSISEISVKNGSGNGIENKGVVHNQGILRIEYMSKNGYLGFPNSELVNDGSLSILNVMENGLIMQDAIVRNRLSGILTIENANLDALRLNNNAQFFQKGDLILSE